MLETTRQNYKYIALTIATLSAGVPLWTYSGSAIDFTDIQFLAVWAAIGVTGSFFALFIINLKMRDVVSSFISGYVIAVIIYFVSRILVSSMVHTQFILSLVMAIVIGLISGFSGSMIWRFIKKK
jgi:predicted neutral ceramidase superfamily lipid hydrolase